MLFGVLKEPKVVKLSVDGVELRLDCFPHIVEKELKALLAHYPSVLFTLRSKIQGGEFTGTEQEREAKILDLCRLKPAYLDLEYDISPPLLERIAKEFPEIRIILSYHNFTETPEDLDELLARMQTPYAYAYKIATMASSTLDALRMLHFVKRTGQNGTRLSGICMGQKGEITRILGPVMGNFIDYGALSHEEASAPGQLSLFALEEIYHYSHLTPQTALYGLIGNPVDGSIGYLTHNAVFHQQKWNAVYVRMAVQEAELPQFFSLAQSLPFAGLSVTMPLKESLFPFLYAVDSDAKKIGAVNTLIFEKEGIAGYNTDGRGALDAIEDHMSVKGKTLVLIGAGGAAKAIAFEAQQRGAEVIVLNRTRKRALELAEQIKGRGGGIEELGHIRYDILLNATPESMPIDPAHFHSDALVMDIKTLPKMTPFLEAAQEQGCPLVFGYEMFLHQALGQFHLWFQKKVSPTFLAKQCLSVV